jgi:hypothetical protein
MSSDLSPRSANFDLNIASPTLIRRTHRQLDQAHAHGIVQQAHIQVAAETAAAVVQARNAVAAAAAQADAQLSGLLAALPIQDAQDADFRQTLKAATRANVIADIYRFGRP